MKYIGKMAETESLLSSSDWPNKKRLGDCLKDRKKLLFYRNRTYFTVTSTVDNSSVLVENRLLRAMNKFPNRGIYQIANIIS
jgi:hypothetical protein